MTDKTSDEKPVFVAADAPAISTTSVWGSYLAGQLAQHQHDYKAAADYLDRALAQDPDNPELINRTFLLRLTDGEMARAAPLAERISTSDWRSGLAALFVLVEHIKSHDGSYAAMVEQLPDEGVLRVVLPAVRAWVATANSDVAAAKADLDEYDRLRGFSSLKILHSALIDDYLGQTDAAEQAYGRMIAGDNRLSWRVVDLAGNFYERRERVGDAKAIYERFAKENPDSRALVEAGLQRIAAGKVPPPTVSTISDGLGEAMFDVATMLNQPETRDVALIYIRLALELKPTLALAQMLVAEIAEDENRLDQALNSYQAIATDSPFSWSARLRSAEILDDLNRTNEAITILNTLAAERPSSSQPLIELGDLLRAHNRFNEAAAAYDSAIPRLGPEEPRYWSVYYSRGIALERSGQWARAENDLQHALDLQPDQPMVLNYLGYSWIEKGQHLDRALKMIERAAELRPDDGYIIDSLGWAFYQIGHYREATQYLERAIERLPQDPTINDHLGDAYWQTGRHMEARYQWQRALQFTPEADEVKTIEAKLDRGLAPSNSNTTAGSE